MQVPDPSQQHKIMVRAGGLADAAGGLALHLPRVQPWVGEGEVLLVAPTSMLGRACCPLPASCN